MPLVKLVILFYFNFFPGLNKFSNFIENWFRLNMELVTEKNNILIVNLIAQNFFIENFISVKLPT